MKKIFLLFFGLFAINAFAQDCEIDSRIRPDYLNDARILALREIYSDTSGDFFDSILIPAGLINKYLEVISAIYSMENEARDTVFAINTIHAFPDVPYMEIAMLGDTSFTWVKTFLSDSLESGNPEFDSIIREYEFKLESYIPLAVGASIRVSTPQYLNLNPLVASLSTIQGLSLVEAATSWVGDGNNIESRSANDTIYIDFSKGWGDCPAGCTERRYWKFAVYDCEASYLGSSGDSYSSIEKSIQSDFQIYPNPVDDIIYIKHGIDTYRIGVYDLLGKEMLFVEHSSEQIDLSGLNPGIYMLRFFARQHVETLKIVKR